MLMIALRSVTRRYGRLTAVDGVSFELPETGVIGLLGQNGAGKSTVLNMMTGYLPPTSGRILIDGVDLQAEPRTCKRKIGYLPEKPPLYPEMTVEEYLRFVCRLREVAGGDIARHMKEILSLCGLEDHRKKTLGSLSKGYQQRAGFAQALCGDPPVLVLDVPTVGLDPVQIREIRDLMSRLGEDHLVVFSTHLLHEAQRLCRRVLILHRGKLAADVDLRNSGEQTADLLIKSCDPAVIGGIRDLEGVRSFRTRPCSREGCTAASISFGTSEYEDVCARLFQLLSAHGAQLLALVPAQNDLEALFVRIAAGDRED